MCLVLNLKPNFKAQLEKAVILRTELLIEGKP